MDDDAGSFSGRRFGGVQRLYGLAPAQRIADAHVVIVGVGGVGSWAAEALARSGVGHLTLIDMDHVAESNINRQVHALETTLGQAKIVAMKERIAQIHPGCSVTLVDDFVDSENVSVTVPPGADAVIDACDDLPAKLALVLWCRRQRIPLVTLGAAGGKTQAHAVSVGDLSEVTHDPLLARLRYRLRREHGAARDGKKMSVRCVFSRESVAPPDPSCQIQGDGSLNCHGYGSSVTVTATFGLCAAGLVMNDLAGAGKFPKKNAII